MRVGLHCITGKFVLDRFALHGVVSGGLAMNDSQYKVEKIN